MILLSHILMNPLLQQVGKNHIVFLGKEEVAVSSDTYLRQYHELCFAAMTVDTIYEHLCHIHSYSPMVQRPVLALRVGNVVAIIYNNKYKGEMFEIFCRDGFCFQYSIRVIAFDRCGNLAFREYEIAAQLVSSYCLYMAILDGS